MAKFQPGKSGNPGGRPKVLGHVQELARAQTEASILALVKIRDKKDAADAAVVAAANALLDRGWGKPSQPVDGDGQGGPMEMVVKWQSSRK